VSVADSADRLAAEEADLVAQIAAGRSRGEVGDAVSELVQRYHKRLYSFGYQILRDGGLAEDMVQETFVRLWQTAAGRYDAEKASVGTYLYVIARSVALDIRKRPSSRPHLPADEIDVPSQSDNIDQIIDSITIREALDSLGAGHAAVLRLSYEQGLTQSQISTRLKIPLGTVKTRMFHGMRAMRTALEERGFDAV
jgi:RNA polymerase sigma-70 factor (ECF subfamily)